MLVFLLTNQARQRLPDISYDIEGELKQAEWTFVRFSAPWCAFSQIAEPEWRKLYTHYGKNVRFVEVNCNSIGQECRDTWDVKGYPAFKLYKNGKFNALFRPTYPRKLDIFTEWLNRQLIVKEE
ncbi:Protein_disulfide isomerase [Hexamita inflata]|uniref:Protein disulfide isomerase n=1 Tax=Hexamita inflata TaxID=28002 RepID=A0AA86U1N0_9EUKA|nr:Protein disulfide isomerase [Hexamita inflata]CAI9941231.1 Protein disulfide isomerase [Hexamita inflata]